MGAFTSGDLATIRGFAAQLGLDARAAPDGSFSFVFDTMGTFTLTPDAQGARTIASLGRRWQRSDGPALDRALQQAGFDLSRGRLLHVGLGADDTLVFMTSLEEGALSLPVLDECLQQLRTAHDSQR